MCPVLGLEGRGDGPGAADEERMLDVEELLGAMALLARVSCRALPTC